MITISKELIVLIYVISFITGLILGFSCGGKK